MTTKKQNTGAISWTDLTVPNAEKVKDFYCEVVGWKADPVDMGGYSDFNIMTPEQNQCVAGICNARGMNADLPSAWMIYISVQNLDQSVKKCAELGGKILVGPKKMGNAQYCVIQDPAGAVAALYQEE